MHQPEKMHGQLLKACGECPTLLQPAQTPLDHIAVAVAHWVIADWPTAPPFAATAAGRDDRADAMRPEPVPDALSMIGFVTANPPWPSPWTAHAPLDLDAVHQGLELGRFVGRARQQQRAERQPVAIHQQVQLGAKATARPA
jgi:hypothetical protein